MQVYGPGGSCANCIRAGRARVCLKCDNGYVGPGFACNNCGNRGEGEMPFASAGHSGIYETLLEALPELGDDWPTDPSHGKYAAQAGTNIEPSVAEEWARRMREQNWQAFPHMQPTPAGPRPLGFPSWAHALFPSQRAPDLIAVHPNQRTILVGDVTSKPTESHWNKTCGYAQRVARAVANPRSAIGKLYPGYRVVMQERYWGLPAGSARTDMSRRVVIAPVARRAVRK